MERELVRYHSLVADSARWEGFAFRPGDIVISTPAKCGTTWTQMICALLVFQTPDLPRPLAEISPWLDMLTRKKEEVFADLEAQEHRRFIKTHTPLDGLPYDDRVIYITAGRDPRDAGLSMGNHIANIDFGTFFNIRHEAVGSDDLAELMPDGPPAFPQDELEKFWWWVLNTTSPRDLPGGSLWALIHHLDTFWAVKDRPNIVLLHYADLQQDLGGQMRALASRLGIDVPEDRWPELVQAATFDEMRGRADELIPNSDTNFWVQTQEFFHRGTSGQWRAFLDDAGLDRYQQRIAELCSPELPAWLHRS